VDTVFESRELIDAYRAACMQPSGSDADLGAETKFATVGKLRRCIMQYDRRVDLA
jgi:hypothetical protein